MVEIPNQCIHFEKRIFETCEKKLKNSISFFFSVFFFCFSDLDFSDYLRSLFSFIFVIFFRKSDISESIWRGFQFLIVFIFRFLSWQYMHFLTQNRKITKPLNKKNIQIDLFVFKESEELFFLNLKCYIVWKEKKKLQICL